MKKLEANGPHDYADRIFIATYGAAFTSKVMLHPRPDAKTMDRYHEEADAIAQEAEDRWLKRLGVTDE